MHHTQVIINFQGDDAFGITILSSFFNLEVDYIIRYHQCFPSWFTIPLLITSYSICSSCQGSTCFVHPFSLVGHWSIWHNNLACIFALPFLVFIISTTGWWKWPPKDLRPFASIHGRGLRNITRKTYNYSTNVGFPKIFKYGTKSYSINTIVSHTCTCSSRGICLSNACIGV
jgi:hypothetical protein